MKPTLLVLAAGMGSRYKGLKQVDPFGPSGETILEYAVYDAARAGFGKVVFVIRQDIAEAFKSKFYEKLSSMIEVDSVFQEKDKLPEGFNLPSGREKPWGTGHALLMAAPVIDTPFAVINADDFYGAGAFQAMADDLKKMPNDADEFLLAGYQLENTLSEHGHVSRGICEVDSAGFLKSITERTKIMREGGQIVFQEEEAKVPLTGKETVSMNLFGFPPSVFEQYEQNFVAFLKENLHEPKKEFYLPFVVNNLIQAGKAKVKVLPIAEKWFGVTYPEDKKDAVEKIQKLVIDGTYPANLWI